MYVGRYILEEWTRENTFKVHRKDLQIISEVAIHSDRFKPCVSRYVKPSYMPDITDEQMVGEELPLNMCREDDYTEFNEETASTDTSMDTSYTRWHQVPHHVEKLPKQAQHIGKGILKNYRH